MCPGFYPNGALPASSGRSGELLPEPQGSESTSTTRMEESQSSSVVRSMQMSFFVCASAFPTKRQLLTKLNVEGVRLLSQREQDAPTPAPNAPRSGRGCRQVGARQEGNSAREEAGVAAIRARTCS